MLSMMAAMVVQAGARMAVTGADRPMSALHPIDAWRVDRMRDGCVLGRRYAGEAGEVAMLTWRSVPLEDSAELTVSARSYDVSFRTGSAVVTLSTGARDTGWFESTPPAGSGLRSMRLRLSAGFFSDAPDGTVLTIAPDGLQRRAYLLRDLETARASLAACHHEMLRSWGVNPAEQSRAAVAATLVAATTVATTEDYPAALVQNEVEGTSVVVFAVDIDGRVSTCRAAIASDEPALDEAACRAVRRNGVYVPARDARGAPVESYLIRRISWRLPKN